MEKLFKALMLTFQGAIVFFGVLLIIKATSYSNPFDFGLLGILGLLFIIVANVPFLFMGHKA